MKISNETKIKMLKTMKRIRAFEENCQSLFVAGYIPGALHCYTGQEAVATGVCLNLRNDDYILSNHRGHGHLIAKGGEFKYMLAELYGKKTGYCKGLGGSMHIASVEHGILGANGIVGGGLCIASGVGFSIKYQDKDNVAVCFFGEGASNIGFFHEALNFASIHKAPVIFVCENNLYGISMSQSRATNIIDISIRATSYGIYGETADGNDVEAVYLAAAKAIDRARSGKGPSLLEFKTYRWGGHHAGEPGAGSLYRKKEEIEYWKEKEPIKFFEKRIIEGNILTIEDIKKMEDGIQFELDEAVEFAENSPYPEVDVMFQNIYV